MRPSHPCPQCGHEFSEECRAVATELPGRARGRCPHCRDDCVPLLHAGPVPREHDARPILLTAGTH